jgi:hypothetical protein
VWVGKPLKKAGFQKKKGGNPHLRKIQNIKLNQVAVMNKISQVKPVLIT